MLSISAHPGIKGAFSCPSLPHQNPNASARFFKTPCSLKLQTPSSMKFNDTLYHKFTPIKKTHRISASSAVQEAEAVVTETPPDSVPDQEIEKTIEKPRLVLKFIWMEKNIGLGLDQVIPGHGHIPLSPYYFWPRKDAWEELKTTLESKPWISQKKMIILLNQATDIINLWQQSGGSLTSQ